ncbi:MAG: hypothetical protein QXV10_03690 [Nitrososphaerota archaeon]
MKQTSLIVLTLIFLLLFNYASASIIDTAFSESNLEEVGFKMGSRELGGNSENLGIIVIDGVDYGLPNNTKLNVGVLYVIGYIPEEGYVFDHWEVEGGELKSSEKQQANIIRVTNNSGSIIAVYRRKAEITITATIIETGETTEEYELSLGKLLSLSIHEVIEEHKEEISFWIFEHKLLVLQKHVDKLNTIEAYQNDLKQRFLEIKEEMRELEENLTNGIIDEGEFIIQMEILRSKLSEIRNSNEKLGHLLGDISKDFSDDLRGMVEERKRIHDEFKEELDKVKEEIKTQIMQTKTKILKTHTKTIRTETTKTPPGQTKKTTTTKTPPGQTKTKEDKGKGK